MKQKNKSKTYIYMAIALAIGLGSLFAFYYYSNSSDDIGYTLTDNSTGESRIITTTYGARTNILHVDDRSNDEHCVGTVEFDTHQTTNGVLKLEVYVNSMNLLSDLDFGLVGETGHLYEWDNITQYIDAEKWTVIEIAYSLEFDKAKVSVDGVEVVGYNYFTSNPVSLTGFYIKTSPSGVIDAYIDIIGIN